MTNKSLYFFSMDDEDEALNRTLRYLEGRLIQPGMKIEVISVIQSLLKSVQFPQFTFELTGPTTYAIIQALEKDKVSFFYDDADPCALKGVFENRELARNFQFTIYNTDTRKRHLEIAHWINYYYFGVKREEKYRTELKDYDRIVEKVNDLKEIHSQLITKYYDNDKEYEERNDLVHEFHTQTILLQKCIENLDPRTV